MLHKKLQCYIIKICIKICNVTRIFWMLDKNLQCYMNLIMYSSRKRCSLSFCIIYSNWKQRNPTSKQSQNSRLNYWSEFILKTQYWKYLQKNYFRNLGSASCQTIYCRKRYTYLHIQCCCASLLWLLFRSLGCIWWNTIKTTAKAPKQSCSNWFNWINDFIGACAVERLCSLVEQEVLLHFVIHLLKKKWRFRGVNKILSAHA